MNNFNWIDWIFLIIIFLSTLTGLSRGFVKEIISLATLIAAFVIAAMFCNSLANFFTHTSVVQNAVSSIGNQEAVKPVSYALIAISFGLLFAGTIIVGTLLGYFLNLAFIAGILSIGNRILGALFGFLRALIICLVIIFIIQLTPLSQHSAWDQSNFVIAYQPGIHGLQSIISPSFPNFKSKVDETISVVNSQLQNLSKKYNDL